MEKWKLNWNFRLSGLNMLGQGYGRERIRLIILEKYVSSDSSGGKYFLIFIFVHWFFLRLICYWMGNHWIWVFLSLLHGNKLWICKILQAVHSSSAHFTQAKCAFSIVIRRYKKAVAHCSAVRISFSTAMPPTSVSDIMNQYNCFQSCPCRLLVLKSWVIHFKVI